MYSLKVSHLYKRFKNRKVLNDISFDLKTGESIAIVGPNGSGKSTLLMLLLSGLHPTKGTIEYFQDDKKVDPSTLKASMSLVSPYLNLYDAMTAEENLVFFATVSGFNLTGKEINALLEKVGLEGRGQDMAGTYSSGMKQRLKYAVALINQPEFIFLDEPTSNLDENGKKIVRDIIEESRARTIFVIATNEEEEQNFARQICRIA